MLDKLAELETRYRELEALLVDPAVIGNRRDFARLSRERASLEDVVACFRDWRVLADEERDLGGLVEDPDPDLRDMARAELPALRKRREATEQALRLLLIPKNPNDERNVILEIRAGTGGEEASLFAADLFRMYTRSSGSRSRCRAGCSASPRLRITRGAASRCLTGIGMTRT